MSNNNTIYFHTPGILDIENALVFGVSAKENNSPLGQFGTGLKYAIAILLRTGHEIEIQCPFDKVYKFDVRVEEFRGTEHGFIYMNGEKQGFTTHLGAHWELWMAYRELYSNTIDEYGSVTIHKNDLPIDGSVIKVTGTSLYECHMNKGEYFIDGSENVIYKADQWSLLEKKEHKNALFYKGVRVHEMQDPLLYSYDFRCYVSLTEDRTIKNTWSIPQWIASIMMNAPKEVFHKINAASENYCEAKMDIAGFLYSDRSNAGEGMRAFVEEMLPQPNAIRHETIRAIVDAFREKKYTEVATTAQIEKTISAAKLFLSKALDIDMERFDIVIVEGLGENILGEAKEGKIFLAQQVFNRGLHYVCSTLLEEYIHLDTGYMDCTRSLQTYLFDMIIEQGKKYTEQVF